LGAERIRLRKVEPSRRAIGKGWDQVSDAAGGALAAASKVA
jgi:hypothetical protein